MMVLMGDLPAEIMGHNVLPMLSCKDVVNLDSAIVCRTDRSVLRSWYQFFRPDWQTWDLRHNKKVLILNWCIQRNLQWTSFTFFGGFWKVLRLASKVPASRRGALTLTCIHQLRVEELEAAMEDLGGHSDVLFKLDVGYDFVLIIRNASVFRSHLTGLEWDATSLNYSIAETICKTNPKLRELSVWRPSIRELRLIGTLGRTLETVTLYELNVTPTDLAELGDGLHPLKRVIMAGHMGEPPSVQTLTLLQCTVPDLLTRWLDAHR
jgi:hypothetical protein